MHRYGLLISLTTTDEANVLLQMYILQNKQNPLSLTCCLLSKRSNFNLGSTDTGMSSH